MQSLAHLWSQMSPNLQLQMSQVSVTDFRAGIDHAEATVTLHATDLARDEHNRIHQHLVAAAKNSTHSLAAAKMVHESKKTDLHDHTIVVGSLVQEGERPQAAVLASSSDHEIQLADLNNQPRQPSPSTMPPPIPPPVIVTATRTGRHTQPDTWTAVASGAYHAPPPSPFDDSYLDVRVPSFRHRDEELPPAIKDQVFNLSIAVYVTLQPIRQTKAPLRLARDLASSKRSSFRPEINDNILTLCDAVRQAYNTPAARPWFLSKIPQPRAPRWQAHLPTDSSGSDSSVGLNRQRRWDDPASGRGKSKRTMTALTVDSSSGLDAPHGTYDGYRYIRQVYPRFYHAPDPDDGTGPPFPPRIARNHVDRQAPPLRPLSAHTPASEPHAQRGPLTVNEDFSPTQLLIETITNATLAAVNQHLMSTGLLLRPTVDPQPTAPSLTRTAPDPSSLVQTTAPAFATNSVQYLNHDARYTWDGGSSHPPTTVPPTAFDRAFATKVRPKYRTLDTRRVSRVQPLQLSPHTNRTAASGHATLGALHA